MSDPRMDALRFRGVDLCAPESHDDPWELYDYLREHDPLYWDEHNALWYVFRYEDVLAISRDPVTFCSTEGNRPNLPADPSMIHQDGTAHAKQRGLVAKGFTPRAMKEIEASCAEIVDTLIDAFLERGAFDAVEDLAAQLPAQLVATMLGAPQEMTPTLRRWIEVMVSGGQGPQYVDDAVNEAFGEFCEHHEVMVAEREGSDDDSDLLLRWMHAELDGQKLEEDQLLFEHALILAGGIETTRNAIAGGLEMLAQDPEAWAYLRAHVDDERVIQAAIEEMTRWVTPFTNMFRTATCDVTLHGKTIREGQMVGLMYPAANRDPSVFKDPHRFDVRRDPRVEKHLAFGFGTHFCLGANLARLELSTTLVALLRKMETLSLAPEGRRERLSSSFIRGLAHLDLTFTRA